MLAFCRGPSSMGPACGVETVEAPKSLAGALSSIVPPSIDGLPSLEPESVAAGRCKAVGECEHSKDASNFSKCSGPAVEAKRIQSKSRKEFNQLYEIEGRMAVSGLFGPSGTFVHHARRISDGEGVAVKLVNKALAFEGCVRDELDWLKAIKCQLQLPKIVGICNLMEVIQTDTHYYMVMERPEGQDLWSWRSRSKVHFQHGVVRAIIKQTLQAVQALHGVGVFHRDLKLETIWVNYEQSCEADRDTAVTVKLVDVGAATTSLEKESYLIGSHGYSAPEAYQGSYSTASDMFAIGVIMYKLLTRKFPLCPSSFDVRLGEDCVGSSSMKRIFKQFQSAEINFSLSPLSDCPEATALCASLLAMVPEQRPTAEQALGHNWFTLEYLPEYKP